MRSRRWAYVAAAVFALSFSYDLLRIPVQITDSLGDIQEALAEPSLAATFASGFRRQVLLRPLKAAQTRVVFDASAGRPTLAYRGVHVLLLALTVWMFVRALQVKTAADVAAAMFALTVFLGLHTFSNLLREAYPINHFLEVMLFGLLALNLAQGRTGWFADAAAALIFTAAALILESGLLVWIVIVAARASGLRGISRRGVMLVSLLLGIYVALRVFVFSTGLPAVDERSSGFFLRVLDADELRERFGQNALPFYLYNVVASTLTVLFSEPRGGQMTAAAQYLSGGLVPWVAVAIVSSAVTTLLIAFAAVSSWRDRAGRDGPDRLFLIFALVLAANAALSFSYAKDDVMSFAGAFYALAAYAAVRRLIRRAPIASRGIAMAICAGLLIASTGWAIRTSGLHYNLRYMAFKVRNEWAVVPGRWMQTPEARAVAGRLRQDALAQRVVAPRFYPAGQVRWFEEWPCCSLPRRRSWSPCWMGPA